MIRKNYSKASVTLRNKEVEQTENFNYLEVMMKNDSKDESKRNNRAENATKRGLYFPLNNTLLKKITNKN